MMDVRHVTPTGLTVHFRRYDNGYRGEMTYGMDDYFDPEDAVMVAMK